MLLRRHFHGLESLPIITVRAENTRGCPGTLKGRNSRA